jgi:hypothetical protein
MISQEVGKAVSPAKAGNQKYLNLDSRFRGNDENETKKTFYEIILFAFLKYGLFKQKIHISPYSILKIFRIG